MMWFSSLPTIMKQLMMRFNGLTKRNKLFLPNICLSSKVVLSDEFINGTFNKF